MHAQVQHRLGDCDGKNDCATNLMVAAANCGSCGKQCSAYCVNGLCDDPVAVAAGDNHTCGILADGSVWCWGSDDSGQLGDGMTANSVVPKKITALPQSAKSIAAGTVNTCAILKDATLWCWGSNANGNLGVGDTSPHTGPQQVTSLSGVAHVAVGDAHACAINSANNLFCWGDNGFGAVGNGTSGNEVLTPTQVMTGVLDVAAGSGFTCALALGGTVTCWGANADGELGDGSTNPSNMPGSPIAGLSGVAEVASHSGASTVCARTASTIACCGNNNVGQLGNGMTTTPQTSPTAVSINLMGGSVTQVAVGGNHGGAVTSSGLYMWGSDVRDQLGDGFLMTQSTPIATSLSGVTSLSLGAFHSCGLTLDQHLFCWGDNTYGQVGNGSSIGLPIAVAWP